MKGNVNRILAVAACLLLCAVFTAILLAYTRPLDDHIYDLSLTWEGEAVPDDWIYDQKGWTVFTQEKDTVTELVPDGYGGFSGLSYPGQTFYFSRTLTENLDAPTLRLGASNRSVAVYLDGELIYSDCFGLECKIGCICLPMQDWDRTEPVVVTLPTDYRGKTLTVAQSTSPYGSELQDDTLRVWPCSVILYCGYAYESSLISESFRTALPAAGLFLTGVFLMVFFVWLVFQGRADIALLCAAMTAFLWMTSRMALASFAYNFFGPLPLDVVLLCRDISRTALLAFLASRCSGKRRVVLGILTALQMALSVLYVVCQLMGWYIPNLSVWLDSFGVLSLLAALALGLLEWRREDSFFYCLFCSVTAAGILIYIAAICVMPALRPNVRQFSGLVGSFRQLLMSISMAAAIAAGGTVGVRQELDRRIEARLLAQRQGLARASYESMREHHEQVMILRHDMAKHFHLLRQMTGERDVADYLDEIIGKNEEIRPVVQSGNEMLDIILNGKLAAADGGIKVELLRMQAPGTLPLSSAELCSLFMNVMDNAVAAALASGAEPPYVLLDLHIKGDFFVFSCKNSAAWDRPRRTEKKGAGAKHGLGLKIIRNISEKYGGLMETEHGPDYYKVILAIPLSGPDTGQTSR